LPPLKQILQRGSRLSMHQRNSSQSYALKIIQKARQRADSERVIQKNGNGALALGFNGLQKEDWNSDDGDMASPFLVKKSRSYNFIEEILEHSETEEGAEGEGDEGEEGEDKIIRQELETILAQMSQEGYFIDQEAEVEENQGEGDEGAEGSKRQPQSDNENSQENITNELTAAMAAAALAGEKAHYSSLASLLNKLVHRGLNQKHEATETLNNNTRIPISGM